MSATAESRVFPKTETYLLYTIDNFNTEAGLTYGGYHLGITMSGLIVAELLNTKRTGIEPLNEMINQRLKGSSKWADEEPAYHEDTWLLRRMNVGGNCACFGIDGHHFDRIAERRNVRYVSHNIDTRDQAAIALSTWLLWFNHVLCLTTIGPCYQ